MKEYLVEKSFHKAINKTKAFFKEKNVLQNWLKITILLLIFGVLGGQVGFNFDMLNVNGPNNLSNSVEKSSDTFEKSFNEKYKTDIVGFLDFFDKDPLIFNNLILLFLAIEIIGGVLLFIFAIVRNLAKFLILESIEKKKVVLSHFFNYFNNALSLAVGEVIFFWVLILEVFLVIIALLGLFVFVFSFFAPELAINGNLALLQIPPFFLLLAILSSLIGILLLIIEFSIYQFGFYYMYTKKVDVFVAIKKGFELTKKELSQVILFIGANILVRAITGFASLITLVIIAIPLALLFVLLAMFTMLFTFLFGAINVVLGFIVFLVLGFISAIIFFYIVNLVLAPISIFKQYFHLTIFDEFTKLA